ncbi:DUF7482 domain-containing protein [Caballeronia sordidicola]|uniref:DUF7482 domain-containing protein n=1 Tax=Caballeronia sordidicola TaxID=196367 RepID=UPI00117FC78F|nr:hypothetical protein [Caballeronia sordidicola]
MYRKWATVFMVCGLVACGGKPVLSNSLAPKIITLPLSAAWYDNRLVYYITTEITDPAMATGTGITLTPRLRDAVPSYPKPPGVKTVLERVYKFPAGDQDAVFSSAPNPVGAASADKQYSPLWLLYTVSWNNASHPYMIKSEAALLEAVRKDEVTVTRTSIVINCPIVLNANGPTLSGVDVNRQNR